MNRPPVTGTLFQDVNPRPHYGTDNYKAKSNIVDRIRRDRKEVVLTFAWYLDHFFDPGYDESVLSEDIFRVMTPAVAPIEGVVLQSIGHVVGKDHLIIDPRPYHALFAFAKKNGIEVKSIDLEREEIVLGARS